MNKPLYKFPWLGIDGDVASLMRSRDWSACPIGEPESWPPQLRTVVGLVLQSRSPAAVVWGPGLTTLYNDAYASQLGAKHPASLGQGFGVLWSEIWDEIEPVIDGAMAGKSFYFEDIPYVVRPAGVPEQRWYTSSFSPVTDSAGVVAGIYITASETTRRMQAERRYAFQAELAERLRGLAMPDEIMATASELLGNFLRVPRVGYAAADAAGDTVRFDRDWTDGMLPSMAGTALRLDDFGPVMAQTLREGVALEVANVAADARSADFAPAYAAQGVQSLIAIPLTKEGRLRAILSVHDAHPHYWTGHDIALAQDMVDRTWSAIENARAQAELRNERDQSEYIFDSMTEGFALLDRNWVVLRMNAEGLRLMQRSALDVIGRNHWEVWPALKGSGIEAMYRQVKETGRADSVEIPYTFPDHGNGWVEVRAYPALDGGLAFFFRDISERKAAQDKLQDADRRKDEFLAMLAHELRNPLAPIAAAAEVLQLARLDEARVRQTSQLIGRQVSHMTSLVNDLLDVSRVTRGLVELDDAPLDIRRIVADAVEQVTPLVRARRHQFVLHLPPDSIMVRGDEKRLVQVVANLLNNAAKYTPEGGEIVLRVAAQAAHVLIEVQDNGIGMAPSLVTRAFDLFAQAERTSDRSSGGLGLGLALVRSLVELHRGTVACESPGAGRGSTFRVCLPRLAQEAHQPGPRQEDAGPRREATALRILVVDDNVDAAAMLAMLLETMGHQVAVEHASLPALERARAEAPQVCVLDIGLPEIDGIELARRLRARPETAHALLVAVTGYGQEQDRKLTRDAGFDHHLVKPVDVEALAAILANKCREPV